MLKLMEFKEKIKNIYAEHEFIIRPIFKFFVCLTALILFKFNIGFMPILNMWVVIVALAIVMAFIPHLVDVVILSGIMVGNIFYISAELGAILLIVMLIMVVMFLKFTPEQGVFLVLVPLAFMLKIPFVIPLVAGLLCTPIAIVSVTFGTVVYFILETVGSHAQELQAMSTVDIQKVSDAEVAMANVGSIINDISSNPNMYLAILAFAITIGVVYAIRRMSIDNAWAIAIVAGTVLDLVITLVCGMIFRADYFGIKVVVIGSAVSLVIAYILQFFVFSVDYSRTEHTQFEDDEYYYYVKAVPKINVTAPAMNVKRINAQRRKKTVAKSEKPVKASEQPVATNDKVKE